MKTTQCGRAGRAGMSHGRTTRFAFVACTAAMVLCCSALGQDEPELIGHWDPPDPSCGFEEYQWVIKARAAIHLPSDEVLIWIASGVNNRVWTHASGCFTPVTTTYHLWCSGHAALSNGSILVAGGVTQFGEGKGIDQVAIYRLGAGWFGGPWELVEPMNHARWYPP